MTPSDSNELKVPGLCGHMGNWVYYTTFMRMRDVADRISLATIIHQNTALDELIQREVESSHSDSIRDYLLHQKERFFNALVIGVYGSAPKWAELSVADKHRVGFGDIPEYIEGALGILVFDGSEKLFAIDGQHRVVGIRKALAEKPELGSEELSVIFVGHRTDRAGTERTRRLFTTLNRYAKPVNKMQIIALDEDDLVAITTRRLLNQHILFKNWTSKKKGKSISNNDRQSFTTIITVYDTMDRYLPANRRGWTKLKRFRPSDAVLNTYLNRAVQVWDGLLQHFQPLRELASSKANEEVASRYRNRDGGHLLFRPVGLSMLINAIKLFEDENIQLGTILRKIAKVPMALNGEPWVGLLWDPANRRMIGTQENQRAALRVLFHGLGGNLSKLRSSIPNLKTELAGILGRQPDQIVLPRWEKIQ